MRKKIIIIASLLSSYSYAMQGPEFEAMVRSISPQSGEVVENALDPLLCAECNKIMAAGHAIAGATCCLSTGSIGPVALLTGAFCCCEAAHRCVEARELEDYNRDLYRNTPTRNLLRLLFCVTPRKKVYVQMTKNK